jgi:hypothetical protein
MGRRRRWRLWGLLGATTGALVLLGAAPAGADVIDPAGACFGQGIWVEEGETRDSTMFVPDDVVEVPQSDTVNWSGRVGNAQLGDEVPRRDISGEVQLDIAGVGTATIDDWGGSSVRAANEGEHEYDMPDVLVNVKMKLKGEHRENGDRVCGGSVYVKIPGSVTDNPLALGAIAGLVISGGALLYAGRPVVEKIYAFEDVNPG